MGFGGHATLSTIIFKKLRLQFPEANLFPVVLLPDDLTLEGWMRESTWREYEEALAGVLALVTDNAVGDPDDLDDRLSVGMASLHCAAHVEPTFGTIGENIAAFQPFSSGWVGLSVVRQRMPSKVVWSLIPPFRRRKLLRGVANELAWHVLTAIKEVTDPKHQLAEHQPPKAEAPGRIAVTLAVVGEDLEILKDDVMDQLRRDQFLKEHPHVVVAFASANFSAPKSTRLRMVQRSRGGLPGILKTCKTWVKDALGLLPRVIQNLIFGTSRQQLFVNVTHFYPIHGAIPRLWKILHGAGAPVVEAEPAYIGFGSFYHINPSPDLSRN